MGVRDYEYVDCRTLGHAWAIRGYFRVQSKRQLVRTVVCARCTTRRVDSISGGFVDRRQYHYPEDYKTSKIPKNTWTREQVRRMDITTVKDYADLPGD